MGCDIHLYRERKLDGVWETDSALVKEETGTEAEYTYIENDLHIWRNYLLFGLLSDVRVHESWGTESPIVKGYPEDMCEEHRELEDDPDYHTPGYCYLGELQDLLEQAKPAMTKCNLGLGTAQSIDWERAEEGLRELLLEVQKGNYFEGLDPHTECRIIICYDN